jgi:hypothetical protein
LRANTKTAKIVCITTIKALNAIKNIIQVLFSEFALECIDLTKPVNCYMVDENQRMEKDAPPDTPREGAALILSPIL